MTVRYEVPIVRYSPTGLDYTFSWSSLDKNEIRVVIRNRDTGVSTEPLRQGAVYDVVDYDPATGGVVRFQAVPDGDVIIYRDTPVTQEVDYSEFDAFPSETHERQMDKDTRILQEIVEIGGNLGNGPPDLSADQREFEVEIENTAGENATIKGWECEGDVAGVFYGEVVDQAPADGAATDKPDGYMWFQLQPGDVGPPPPTPDPGPDPIPPPQPGDLQIVMDRTQVTLDGPVVTSFTFYRNNTPEFPLRGKYELYQAPSPSQFDAVNRNDFGPGQVFIRIDIVQGAPTATTGTMNAWVDMYEPDLDRLRVLSVACETGFNCTIDAGICYGVNGQPDTSSVVTKRIVLAPS